MITIDDKQIIKHSNINYIKIYKNASRSIISNLEKLNISVKSLLDYNVKKCKKIPFSFSFVRNPYGRVLTLYKYSLKMNWITDKLTFSHFIDMLCIFFNNPYIIKYSYEFDKISSIFEKDKLFVSSEFTQNELDFYSKNTLDAFNTIRHSFPQTKFIYYDNKMYVDFIGKLENVEKDWCKICDIIKEKFSLNVEKKLPIINETINGELIIDDKNREFVVKDNNIVNYDETLKQRVYEIYKKDFELLNYDKDSSVKRNYNKKFKLEGEMNDVFFDFYFHYKELKEEKSKLSKLSNLMLNDITSYYGIRDENYDDKKLEICKKELLIKKNIINNIIFEKSLSTIEVATTLLAFDEKTKYTINQIINEKVYFLYKLDKIYVEKLNNICKNNKNINRDEKINLLKYNFCFYDFLTIEEQYENIIKYFNKNLYMFPKYYLD